MKKTASIILTLLLLLAVLLPCEVALADDNLEVDITVVGDDPTVNVDADGDNPAIYINGQDIQKPTMRVYTYENRYDDTALKKALEDLRFMLDSTEANLVTTSEGLISVIQVLDVHTTNMRDMLDYTKEAESASVDRDNELVDIGKEQDSRIQEVVHVVNTAVEDIDDSADRIAALEELMDTYRALVDDYGERVDRLESRTGYWLIAITVVLGACIIALAVRTVRSKASK